MVVYVAVEKTSFCFDKLFKYVVPQKFLEKISIGSFVVVPFGKANIKRQGVVFKLCDADDISNLKYVLDVLSEEIFLTKELLAVAKYMHSIYFCSWFETIRAILPTGFFYSLKRRWKLANIDEKFLNEEEKELFLRLKQAKEENKLDVFVNSLIFERKEKEKLDKFIEKKILVLLSENKRRVINKDVIMIGLKKNNISEKKLTKKQKILLDYIKKNGEVPLKKACYFCGVTNIVAKNLLKMGFVYFFEKHIYKNPYKKEEKFRDVFEVILNKEQEVAKEGILNIIKKGIFSVSLLKGVTGSGKTQVFLKLIDYVIKSGKDCLLLVPEISLTSQLVLFFKAFFKENVAVLHSGISSSEQMDEYLRIFNREAKLIIGTRSAVFAPCRNLGLIIMDEEEGSFYKNSDMSPRYDAKDIAKFRCFKACCVLLLASATPSIETNYLALKGIYEKFDLKKRYSSVGLPKVFVVDMLKAKMSKILGVSSFLFEEIIKNLEKKEQTILFLNRRGYNLNVFCLDCGSLVKCENCSASMIFHKTNKTFMCHHCGAIKRNVNICSVCKSSNLVYCGQGTQKIEDLIKENIDGVRVLRLDADSTFSRTEFEEKIKKFEDGEYDILLGTQLVAKGLNFLNVTLVGVLSIDGILSGADFKSSERAFCLLTQVVGRSGRAEKVGRAVIQTYNPKNKIISWAAKQDYDIFYENEIRERKEFFCPPFCDLFIINFSGKDEKKLFVCARDFISECRKNANINLPFKILGISVPYVEMVNKMYRKRIIIKCKNSKRFREWIRNIALKVFSSRNFVGVRVNIDINAEII